MSSEEIALLERWRAESGIGADSLNWEVVDGSTKKIIVTDQKLTEKLCEELKMFKALETLEITTSIIFSSLSECKRLVNLRIEGNGTPLQSLERIAGLSSLVQLNLVNCKLEGAGSYSAEVLAGKYAPFLQPWANGSFSVVNFAEWSPFVASIKKTEDSGIPAEQRPDLDAWVNACAPLMNNAQPSFEDWVIIFPQLMIMHPKAVMKKIGGPAKFTERIKGALRLFLRKLCEAQNPCVLNALVRLWFALTYAAKRHIADETELLEYAKEVASITSELCKCHALYNKGAAYRLLLPKQYWPSNTAASPDNDSKESTSDEEDKNEEARRANHEALWCAMHVFRADGPIKLCMDCGFKQVLASAMVVDMMRYLFYNGIDFGDKQYDNENIRAKVDNFFEFSMMASVNFWGMYCPRYTPVVMFLLEGASKSFLLLLVSWVVLGVYGRDGHSIYAHTKAEGFLVLMLTTYLIYELGLLSERNWSLRKHFGNVWNALDAVSLSLILMWALLSPSARSFDVSRGALCLSAIPLSLQILQYISLVKSFGLLVLMIRSMFVDVLMFVVVYVVCIFGFGVCFHGLFYGHAPFNSKGGTLLFLINATLGEFDFDELADIVYIGLGTTVLVLFLVLTTVLLLNLLIAQMSSTYNRIMDRSREEWSFVLASSVNEYVLLRERTPLCMLPPPLNAITAVLAPVHFWALAKHRVSIAGSVADFLLGIVMLPIRFLVLVLAVHKRLSVTKNSRRKLLLWWPGALFFWAPYAVFSSLARIFYVTVHVVPAAKDEESQESGRVQEAQEGADFGGDSLWGDICAQWSSCHVLLRPLWNNGEYYIWYFVPEQVAECKAAGLLSSSSTPASGDGIQGSNSAPPQGELGAGRQAAVDQMLVLFTKEDIERMFPAYTDPQIHRTDDGAESDPASAEAVAGLRREIAEMKTAQLEMMALMKKLLPE